jgi:hypothetical protein
MPASAPEIRNTFTCAAPMETPPASADPLEEPTARSS